MTRWTCQPGGEIVLDVVDEPHEILSSVVPVWRIQVQATISRTFSTNCGSLEKLKFSTLRLQIECMPDPNNSVLRQTRLRGHQPGAPAGAVFGHRFQRLGYDFFNLLIRNLPRCADPRLIQQAVQTELPKSFPPLAHGRTCDMQLLGDFRVAHPLATGKHDASTHRHGLSRFWTKSNSS